MTPQKLDGISGIESLIFGEFDTPERIFVYLHGAGEFGKGFEGQYKYSGFASLLRDNEIDIEQPFVVACCLIGDCWCPVALNSYLSALKVLFNNAEIDLIGYSRGGFGVYEYIQNGGRVGTATIINSRIPEYWSGTIETPLHIIHSIEDQNTPVERVLQFAKINLKNRCSVTTFDGDHFSIERIVKSNIWLN